MKGPSDDQVVVRGPSRKVAYAVDASGNMPARDFLSMTKGKRAPTAQEKAGLYHLFQVMASHGEIRNKQQFKKVQGEIYGFKKYQARIAAFQVGDVWYLTHGFKKKQDKWSPSEISRAERIRQEHLKKLEQRNDH
jgi:Phage derived protein Gp49-like (DUF891)